MERKRDLDSIWAELKPRIDEAVQEEVGRFNDEAARLGLDHILIGR
jgi:hypothetical protein